MGTTVGTERDDAVVRAPDDVAPAPVPSAGGDDGGASDGAAPAGRGPARRPRTARRVLLVVLLLLAVAVGWLVVRGVLVVGALRSAEPEVRAVHAALAEGDVEAASAHLPALSTHAQAAAAGTQDPVWQAASVLPWVGAQLRAVEAVASALDLTATDVLPALADVAGVVDPAGLAPVDGTITLSPLVAAQPAVASAADAALAADALVAGVATEGLLPPLADAVEQARGPLAEAAGLLARADQALTLLPPMLGADGPRDYLLLVLNPAELRSAGGIVASVAVLHADGGRLELREHVASGALPRTEGLRPGLGEDEVAVHGERLASIMQNTTMTPDFPRAAELAVGLWTEAGGGPVDGALAVEPVALAHLLAVTGPVTAPDGTVLDADGVVQALLHDSYARYLEPTETDAFFVASAAAVFDALLDGPVDVPRLGSAFGDAVAERRIALWSAHAEEQAELATTPLGSAFFGETAAPAAGVFLDDGTGTKLDYFLDADVSVTCAEPGPGGVARATLVVEMTSSVPADLASLPPYMTFNGQDGPPDGVTRTNVTLYSPVGGRVADVTSGGAALGAQRAQEAGRDAAVVTVSLPPGGSTTLEATVELPAGQDSLSAWRTPGMEGGGTVPPTLC